MTDRGWSRRSAVGAEERLDEGEEVGGGGAGVVVDVGAVVEEIGEEVEEVGGSDEVVVVPVRGACGKEAVCESARE